MAFSVVEMHWHIPKFFKGLSIASVHISDYGALALLVSMAVVCASPKP